MKLSVPSSPLFKISSNEQFDYAFLRQMNKEINKGKFYNLALFLLEFTKEINRNNYRQGISLNLKNHILNLMDIGVISFKIDKKIADKAREILFR